MGITPPKQLARAKRFPLLPTQAAVTASFSCCRKSPCSLLPSYDKGSQLWQYDPFLYVWYFFPLFNYITVSWGEVLKLLFCAFLISLVPFCSLSMINDSHRLLPLTSFFTILHVLWCMQMCVIKTHQWQHCSTAVYFPKITLFGWISVRPFQRWGTQTVSHWCPASCWL